ncbi:MAG TPA: methenyltetrahydromethanopterin cyclohydrolase [Chromatiales bacterium]|nr:methenyltetrahydromethanopterin cyclohydrolase [Thiotrichales bacterium]HIP68977.1 methenyltetrahydromethanopterin cyclohydrolase [Chromatiales bacterium]
MSANWPSLNRSAQLLIERFMIDADALRVTVDRMENGVQLIDAGIDTPGGLEAGRRVAEICMAGLGSVSLTTGGAFQRWPLSVHVHTSHPVASCLGSQYAGWSLSHGEGKSAFHALGSGPGRSLAVKEPLFKELGYQDKSSQTCLILEVDKTPPLELTEKIIKDCQLSSATDLTLILTPTRSLAGTLQVVARVLEVALHKVHELKFPLDDLVDGAGSAPVPPPAADFVQAMGRTNDAILFGGRVQLYVNGSDEDARDLAERLPSSSSRDYGRPFAEIFKAYDYDFFQIDPMLFSPAEVVVTALKSGNSFHAGQLDQELLEVSFGGGK